MKPKLETEYVALRTEILYWQTFRFTVLAATTAIATGIFTVSIDPTKTGENWLFRIDALLAFVFFAALLSLYASRGNVMLGEYIRRFHEPPLDDVIPDCSLGYYTFGWETRRLKFSEIQRKGWKRMAPLNMLSLSWILALYYFVLGLVFSSIIISRNHGKGLTDFVTHLEVTRFDHICFLATAFFWLLTTGILAFRGSPSESYRAYWREVDEFETKHSPDSTQHQLHDPKPTPDDAPIEK